ncbi:hypothetical protein HYS47_01230 [Candidatus Woesearchaeota archaeon]|nr:hypothetical protein [Candidatus Woesearchaeota archaeon]
MVKQGEDSSHLITNALHDSVEWVRQYNQRIEDERQRYRGQPLKVYGASTPPEQVVSQPAEGGTEESLFVADSLNTPQRIRDYHALNARLVQAGVTPQHRVAYLQLYLLHLAFQSRPKEIVARAQRSPEFRRSFQDSLRLDELLQRELRNVGIQRLTPLRSIDPTTAPHNI